MTGDCLCVNTRAEPLQEQRGAAGKIHGSAEANWEIYIKSAPQSTDRRSYSTAGSKGCCTHAACGGWIKVIIRHLTGSCILTQHQTHTHTLI